MDALWDKVKRKPTSNSLVIVPRVNPTPEVLELLIVKLSALTKRLGCLPYDPTIWKARSSVLRLMRYPELAASDAYKALLLCNAAIGGGPRREDVLLHFGMATWQKKVDKKGGIKSTADFRNEKYKVWLKVEEGKEGHIDRAHNALRGHRKDIYLALIDDLLYLDASEDGIQICKEALLKYPKNKELEEAVELSESTRSDICLEMLVGRLNRIISPANSVLGGFEMQKYPWTPKEMDDRSDEVNAACNGSLQKISATLAVRNSDTGGYDMLAKTDLGVPTQLIHCFNCCQHITAISRALVIDCCRDVFYCSAVCRIQARDNYHQVMHGKDYSQLYKDADRAKGLEYSDEFTKLVFLRILAICVQAGVHPLKNFLFAGLPSPTGTDKGPLVSWSPDGHVKGPINFFEEFGINVFTNLDYDAWVLEELWYSALEHGLKLPYLMHVGVTKNQAHDDSGPQNTTGCMQVRNVSTDPRVPKLNNEDATTTMSARSSSSESQGSNSHESESTRPNRWAGPPSTWQTLTAQERGLATSLDALRDKDLGVHLYNAHAWKKRVESEGGINEEDEDAQEPFVPPKSWSAWPLPPNRVPRDEEQIGEEDPDEAFTFRRREAERPSAMLEDILLGLSLKSAKERFEKRKWALEEELVAENIVDEEDSLVVAPDPNSSGDEGEPVIKEQTPEKTILQPVVSADDDRSREILRPTIRHTLSKLDDILMALHHARKTCRRYSSQSAPDTNDERNSASEEEGKMSEKKKSVGRPNKFDNLAHRSRPDDAGSEPNAANIELLRTKKPGRGRKPKQYPRLDGETDHEYIVRIARLQKKPIPIFSSAPTGSPSPAPKSPAKAPKSKSPAVLESAAKTSSPHRNQGHPEGADRNYRRKLELRDWSEVLGSAALVGFPPNVIARASQRCANLFGESMIMRTMVETPFGDENADTLTTYQPEQIPDFDSESEASEDDSDEPDQKHNNNIQPSKPLGYAPKTEVCFCPIKGCSRELHGFSNTEKLHLHMKRGHKMSKEEIAEFDIPSDEEMDGAAHVDGFLRPEKRALRGHDKNTRKRRRKVVRKQSHERGWTTSSESNEHSEEDVIKEEGAGDRSEDEDL